MDFQLIKGILLFSIFILLLTSFIIVIFSLPFLIRSLRISRIAKKYGLVFKSNLKLQILEPREEKINICEGIIFGKHIEIFDHIDYKAFLVSPINDNARISSRETVMIIDGETRQIKGGLFLGYASISSIEKAIMAIKNRESDYTDISVFNNKLQKNIPITYALFFIILIIAFIIYCSSQGT